jgi:hypothetical protein
MSRGGCGSKSARAVHCKRGAEGARSVANALKSLCEKDNKSSILQLMFCVCSAAYESGGQEFESLRARHIVFTSQKIT